jgi:hypothetical protein
LLSHFGSGNTTSRCFCHQRNQVTAMALFTEKQFRRAEANCSIGLPSAQPGLQALVVAVDEMINANLLEIVEDHLLCLNEKTRRLLSYYGAVGCCLADQEWAERSYDATHVIYASVWEYWKGEGHWSRFPGCASITNWNSAGNIIEALLGVAWIHIHHRQGQDLDAIQVSDFQQEQAWGFVRAWGAKCAACAPILEHAIIGMNKVWEACPWIQTSKADYNCELVQTHLEALRLGFPSGVPFYVRGLPVFPCCLHKLFYRDDALLQGLEDELQLCCKGVNMCCRGVKMSCRCAACALPYD